MVSFWPWGSDKASPASFEKTLSTLSAKITTTQATLDKTRASARRVKVLWVLYLGFAYLVYAILQLVVVGYVNMGLVEWAGIAGAPIFIILTRKLIGAYFNFRTDILAKRLKDQQEERAKTIQQLKDATKYDSTMELIEKYGGGKKKEGQGKDPKQQEQQQQPQRQQQQPGAPNRTRMPPPPTANIQHRAASGGGPPPLSGPPTNSGPSPPDPNTARKDLEPGAEFAPNAFSHPSPPPPQRHDHSAPIAPASEAHWYDRIFDVLLGEDETAPKNRIVLICQACRLVNGQAPPGTRSLAELGLWRCMGCHAQNGTVDEGKRIVDEVLASSSRQHDADDEDADAQVKKEESDAVNVSGSGKKIPSATGVDSTEEAKRRPNKGQE